MKICIALFCLILIQSCAKRTSLGFEEYMGVQIGQPISDVYKNGFQPTNV